MGKVKPKKQNTFIDMTAMSDVTVLLLTFFMSTTTFLQKEPVQVITPGSVVDYKIPDAWITTILLRPDGLCYLNFDRPADKQGILERIASDYNLEFTPQQRLTFASKDMSSIGVSFKTLPALLSLQMSERDALLKTGGLAVDSANNELKQWLQYAMGVARDNGKDYQKDYTIVIKADKSTPYPSVNRVISTLQELKLNRFNLITSLETMPNILANNNN